MNVYKPRYKCMLFLRADIKEQWIQLVIPTKLKEKLSKKSIFKTWRTLRKWRLKKKKWEQWRPWYPWLKKRRRFLDFDKKPPSNLIGNPRRKRGLIQSKAKWLKKNRYRMKQRFKRFYANIRETTLKKGFLKRHSTSIESRSRRLGHYEKRLDMVLFRLRWVIGFRQARQWISHGFIKVSGKKTVPSHQLKPGDMIHIDKRYFKHIKKRINRRLRKRRTLPFIPEHLIVNYKSLIIGVLKRAETHHFYPFRMKVSTMRNFARTNLFIANV